MKRRIWLRLNAAVFAVLFLACLAAAAWLSTRFVAEWQWAGAARTQLSESTQRLLSQLDGPVQVTAFVPDDAFLQRHLSGLLRRYASEHSDFSWEFVNPEARPDLVRRLGVRGSGELVIEYRDRREQVQVPTEAHISAALERLQRGAGQRIGFVAGHGARSLTGDANYDLGAFGRALEGKGYRLQPVRLGEAEQVPDEVDLLLVAGPQTPLVREREAAALAAYVQRGGALLWLVDPGEADRVPVLAELTAVEPQPGVLIDPKAGELLAVDDQRLVLLEEYPRHGVTERLQAPVLLPQAAVLGVREQGGWLSEPLLVSAPHHRQVLAPDAGDAVAAADADERLLLAVALNRELGGEADRPRRQRAVVVGDGDFLSNTYIGNGGNLQLGLNLVDWLTDSEVFLGLYAQAVPDQRLELSRGATLGIGFGFLFGLPLLFLGLGGWQWWRRRSG